MTNLLRGVVLTLIAVAIALYVGDWAVFKLRGSPQASIMVHHFVSAPLKNKHDEVDYLGSDQTICAIAMLPQAGKPPCWYLRRHTNGVVRY